MTIIITKTKLALGILAMVLVGATVAAASDGVFTDNPSGTYYHDPVEWAYDNGITTGTSATTFSPMDSVTRGQNVTFAYRYDQNIVQPALDVLEAGPEISHFLYMTTHTD
ncbi:MAG: S-layer homology domain-containing protein, partial [Acidimicrobiales bacterium]